MRSGGAAEKPDLAAAAIAIAVYPG